MSMVNKYYKKLKHKFKWMISVDADEFITTKKNISNTIKDELNTTFKYVDCINIPWVMMSCNNRDKNPKSILLENTYRWNHNKRHPSTPVPGVQYGSKFRSRYESIEVKYIVKTCKYNKLLHSHRPGGCVGNCLVVDSINKKMWPHNQKGYKKLRETDIKNGGIYFVIITE